MGLRSRKKTVLIFLFFVGLIIGLVISYGIRLLSNKSSLCRQTNLAPSTSSSISSAVVKFPDQIVNLASNQWNTSFGDSSGDDRSSSSPITASVQRDDKPRQLLFVGVMTASVFLATRARAVWETWGKTIPGKVVFFTGGNAYSEERRKSFNESFPLVLLPGVDDSYPPQKKSFMMLKYMYENYGDKYEWFMRADDDVYVRGNKLAEFLRQIDSRHIYFIGTAGQGNQVDKGTLNLAHNENFCMGGPGIILSFQTLNKVAPHAQQCLKDMYSTHEDVEVGRCVKRFAKISCLWAYEMQTIFHHNSSGDLAFTGKLKRREVNKAITLHPIKDFKHLYRLHVYFEGLKIQDMLYEKILIQRDINYMSQFLPLNKSLKYNKQRGQFNRNNLAIFDDGHSTEDFIGRTTGFSPSLTKFSPTKLNDIIDWDFIGKGIFSAGTISPKLKLKSDGKEALEDIVREVMDIINGYSRARGRIVDFKEILYGYRRVNPVHGSDYILDLLMTYRKYRGRKITIPVRRHVYIQRPFSPLQISLVEPISSVEDQSIVVVNTVKTKIVMIVPLAGRYSTFKRFLDNFHFTCMELYQLDNTSQHVSPTLFDLSLVVVLFGTDDEKDKFLHLVQRKRDLLSWGNDPEETQCKIQMVQLDTEFARGQALETGISQCNDEDLLFLIDVDLTFSADVLRRVNLNTKQGRQAYFPIVFSQYNPKFYSDPTKDDKGACKHINGDSNFSQNLECQINSDLGYWREFGYGIGSFYKSDFRKAGGFDTKISGWGKEDVALFDRFLQHTNLTIFRGPDPHLVHVFHENECDRKLPKSQLEMCLGSQANTLGSDLNLMKHLLKQRQ
ncbi:chondroitin sulfate synthase 1 [Folsomia candida]|uniref:chondroitin sulfate synthase 1 n=1 Tax=Folsomia candida TaxID=158441 RepID=UPI001604DC99|nr:chondroitin sulfate synthase 1 [Folsomia candida]